MRRLLPLLLILSALVLLGPAPRAAAACGGSVGAGGGSTTVGVGCALSPGDVHGMYGEPGADYRMRPHCGYGISWLCLGPDRCDSAGHYYDVYRSGELLGTVCLTPGQYDTIDDPWPADVAAAAARQDWPGVAVRIQPPGGRTLVNLATNFYTEDPGVRRRTVTLLGHPTDLRLTPASYTWHYGDGASRTSAGPGSPYPSLSMAHTYAARATVHPSVDVTYAVAYRYDDGAWTALGSTVTEPGPPATLRVLTARPVLIAP